CDERTAQHLLRDDPRQDVRSQHQSVQIGGQGEHAQRHGAGDARDDARGDTDRRADQKRARAQEGGGGHRSRLRDGECARSACTDDDFRPDLRWISRQRFLARVRFYGDAAEQPHPEEEHLMRRTPLRVTATVSLAALFIGCTATSGFAAEGVTTPTPVDGTPGHYIVVMKGDPLATYDGDTKGL